MKLSEAKDLYLTAKNAYYNGNGNSPLTDAQFDALEDSIKKVVPDWKELKKTGAPVAMKKQEMPLLLPMPSLDKLIYGDGKPLQRWLTEHERALAMPKYDGASMQGVYENGRPKQLITRGDGVLGKDCSYFLPYVNLPQKIDTKQHVVIRFEAVFPISTYNKKWSDEFKAARSAVSGVLNRQDVHAALKDIKFIALRNMTSTDSLSDGLKELKELGFEVAPTAVISNSDDAEEKLARYLSSLKSTFDYELDGLVLCSTRKKLPHTEDKPAFMKAWKLNDLSNAVTATIKHILWTPSRFGILVPKAILNPVRVQGATVKQATLNNAQWMIERGIGAGAVVKLIRSGEIIPKVVEVIKKAKFVYPDKTHGKYSWDEKKTHLVLDSAGGNADVQASIIQNMFTKLGADGFGEGVAKRLVTNGFTTPLQVLKAKESDFLKLEGFGERSAAKSYAELKRVKESSFDIATLMVASGAFDKSIGTTRINSVLAHSPEFLKEKAKVTEEDVASIPGVGPAFAAIFVPALPKFWKWLSVAELKIAAPVKKKTVKGKWSGQVGCWTGYRSESEEEEFESNGGTVSSFSSKVTVLFFKSGGKQSSKLDKAKERGITVTTWKAFAK